MNKAFFASILVISCAVSDLNGASAVTKHKSASAATKHKNQLMTADRARARSGGVEATIPADCSPDTTPLDADQVIKLVLSDNFSVKGLTRKIVLKDYDSASGRVSGRSIPLDLPSSSYSSPMTRWDIDVMDSHIHDKKKYIAVKIILKDADVGFWEDPYTVTTVDPPTNPRMFCGLSRLADEPDEDDPVTMPPKNRIVVRFFLLQRRISGTTHGFNLHLMIRDKNAGGKPYSLPIIVDPKVINNG